MNHHREIFHIFLHSSKDIAGTELKLGMNLIETTSTLLQSLIYQYKNNKTIF